MRVRHWTLFLLCTLCCISSSNAQKRQTIRNGTKIQNFSADDSLKIKRQKDKEEIKLNKEAVNAIIFNYMDDAPTILDAPKLDQHKKNLEFREDAVKDMVFIKEQKSRKRVTMQLNPNSHSSIYDVSENDIRNRPVAPFTKDDGTMQAGIGVRHTFDAQKLLTENLTKRGRTLRHNRKYANAWKHYRDDIPEKGDSIKKDSTIMLQTMYDMADRLYPLKKDSLSSQTKIALKHKVDSLKIK
ncbi:MAG: hypothetical protein ACTTKN_04845 [Phocaeicola sp.]|uniref:hypothetical protein n=1 Tax=Phocaeicola sp. TaxID=2773926 RepID=UPI003FA10761